MSNIVLPTKPTKSELKNPNSLIIFGLPKIGKTTIVGQLPNCLVINLEDPEPTCDGMFMYAESYKKLNEILDAIIEAGKPYDYIAIDTMTKLEEFCLPEAARLYAKTPMGVNWIVKDAEGKIDKRKSQCFKYNNDITFLPNGSGYQYVRSAFAKITSKLKQCAPNIIYIAHVKEKNLMKDGVEFTSNDLNLLGKNKQALSADAQAIAYLSRVGNKDYLSFQSGNDILAGCKVKRLADKEILISEVNEKGELITHWDQIYIK